MSNDQTIRFGGDVSGLSSSVERGKRGIEGLDNAAKKAGKTTKSLGDQLEQTFTGMAKGVLITAAIAKSLEAAADAAKRLREASAKASETRGGEAVRVEQALMASGAKMTAEQRQSILGMVGEGAVKPEESVSFIEAYAKKRGRRLTYADITRATQAYQSGAYTQEELMDMRMPPSLIEQRARFAQMTPEARAELGARFRLNQQGAAIRTAVAPSESARMIEGERELQRRESPIASILPDTIGSLPMVGQGITEAGNAGLQATIEAGGTPRIGNFSVFSDRHIQMLLRAPKPITGTQGNRE